MANIDDADDVVQAGNSDALISAKVVQPGTEKLHGPDGKLTRAAMIKIVRSGGSIMHKHSIIWNEKDLPSEADLAETELQKEEALASIRRKIAELSEQADSLLPTGATKVVDTPSTKVDTKLETKPAAK